MSNSIPRRRCRDRLCPRRSRTAVPHSSERPQPHRIPRRTTLAVAGVRVDMVEHIMAALAGLRIDNCEVWVDQPEMPGCDGSSLPFVEACRSGDRFSVRGAPATADRSSDSRGRRFVLGRSSSAAFDGLCLQCLIDYGPSGPIGRQAFQLIVTPESFAGELAAARTFLLEQEAAWLRSQGLGSRVTSRDLLGLR
jgi:UDP-3-O-[3-hydroxymyristoyl] N-acetylglucosamine deacetylase